MNFNKYLPVDSTEWELSKENVQPIKQGRKIPNLISALAPNGEDAWWKLQKEKQAFEAEIRTYDGEDPLGVWNRYILWTEENVPKGGREISTLLERCIAEFKDDSTYKCDERYLEIWLKYADCCTDPLEIFNYMHSQGIGSALPQFYIAWASAYENIENYGKADQVFILGMERNAQPLEMLQKYHMGFQHRLASRIATNDNPHDSSDGSRNALGSLKTSGKKKNVGVLRISNANYDQTGNKTSLCDNPQNPGQSFSLFHDPNSENKSRLPDAVGDWKEPPTQSKIVKENVDLPGKWTKGKPPSKNASAVSLVRPGAKSNFQVHVEENAEQSVHNSHQIIGSQVLSTRKPELEALNDPLKVIVNQNENGCQVKFKVMYDKKKVYTGTEEFQLEEIRAAKYFALRKQGQPLPADILRLKKEQEPPKSDSVKKREKVMYRKEKVYSLEGEFQPEEIVARVYYQRGRCLRQRKASKVYHTSTNRVDLTRSKTHADFPNPLPVQTDEYSSLKAVSPAELNKRNLPISEKNELVKVKLSEIDRNEKCGNEENYLVEHVSNLNIEGRALKKSEEIRLSTMSQTSDQQPINNLTQNTVCPKLFDKTPQPSREKLVSSLAGPSPTLTTKQAFAEVMPWFNTTVGLDNSDAQFEANFKNDPNAESNVGLFEVLTDGKFDAAGIKGERTISSFQDENEENLPPVGYNQRKVERPKLGILQPSIGIPVEPLEERQSGDDEDRHLDGRSGVHATLNAEGAEPIKLKRVKDNCDEVDLTQFQGLTHSEFTAAARLASTPFEEQADPLPTFHCSTIHLSDVTAVSAQNEAKADSAESERSSGNTSGSSLNTPSKGLSPILECSDEDGKSSSSGASCHSSGNSKSNVVSQPVNQCETFKAYDTSFTRCETLERSHDITAHDANGDVLKTVNPFDPQVCNNLLSQLGKPVNTYSCYHDLRDQTMTKITPQMAVALGEDLYRVGKKIGNGAYAKVYSANKLSVDLTNDEEEDANSTSLALKIQTPANEWEFYVCSELHRRLKRLGKSEEELSTIIKIEDFYVFANGSCCITALHKKGTFLDLVNYYKVDTGLMEHVAVYYAMEMMKILECIHECGIIHGDIKPDNLVLIGENSSDNEDERGIALIDFGCAIDVSLFPPGTRFTVNKNTDSFECIEMKTGRPWTTQVDTYGMLGSLHCLIFGEYMKVYNDPKNGRWRPTKLVNRAWNRNLWTKLFDIFLNIPSCDELPSIKAVREEFQEYFDQRLKQKFAFHKRMQTSNLRR